MRKQGRATPLDELKKESFQNLFKALYMLSNNRVSGVHYRLRCMGYYFELKQLYALRDKLKLPKFKHSQNSCYYESIHADKKTWIQL